MKVYDLVVRHFIAVFYPDCELSRTMVLGRVATVDFKATGKEVLKPGWKVVFEQGPQDTPQDTSQDTPQEASAEENEAVLPAFVVGESGPHRPLLKETWTSPPKPYTEATLLRAMETAGKGVEDESLREALKENGIGRPSTRAAIIETLFKRNYIRKERKNLIPTPTGIELIGTIREDLLKSAELTGQWERKLRMIEKGEYQAPVFLDELKEMVQRIVREELHAPSQPAPQPGMPPVAAAQSRRTGIVCPKCGNGVLLRGKTAYGCSDYKNGCAFRIDYSVCSATVSEDVLQDFIRQLN